MKIILRKRDSVVSVILFIFNIFHEYTGSYSIKLDHLIRWMGFFDKNETAARMGLSRLVKSEILINKKSDADVYYELTQLGKDNINLWNLGVTRFFKRYSLRHQQWNKKWYMLALLNFSRTENQTIMDELMEIGFRELSKDLWIAPYPMSQEANDLLAGKYDFFEISGEIRGDFNNQETLEKIFGTATIKSRYNDFLALSNSIENKMSKYIHNNGEYLPLLFELGWNFYDIAINDPVLPEEFLDSWIGDKAVATMRALRSSLYKNITLFFNEQISKN